MDRQNNLIYSLGILKYTPTPETGDKMVENWNRKKQLTLSRHLVNCSLYSFPLMLTTL